jgi:signal peptidase I
MTDPQQTHESNEVTPEETSEATAPVQTEEAPAMASEGDGSEEGAAPVPGPRDFFGLQSFLNVLVIVIFVITFVVQAFRVPSESMENTLLVGDFILADKLHFGQDGGIWHTILPYRPIRRGDIVVFRYPVDPSQYFVKRVIGLPGDRIHLNGGTVYLNGKRQDESYVIHSFPYPNFYRDNFPTQGYMSPETDRKWRLQMLQHVKDGDLVVPPDSYFVMGDNRDRSLDSRYWGFVPRGNITARPLVIYMSVNERDDTNSTTPGGKLIHSGHTLAHFLQLARWGRMFRLVH